MPSTFIYMDLPVQIHSITGGGTNAQCKWPVLKAGTAMNGTKGASCPSCNHISCSQIKLA